MRVLGIFPTFQHLDFCQRAVDTFLANTPDSGAIVVDDGTPLKEWKRQEWPAGVETFRFEENDQNPTRGWNFGLCAARERRVEYAVCANSDLLFPDGWFLAIERALTLGRTDLAGPLTNAPGPSDFQQVKRYLPHFRLTDDLMELGRYSWQLFQEYANDPAPEPACVRVEVTPGSINGFCMVARTATWWKGQYDANEVFNPKKKMIGAEDELQRRWKRLGLTYGAVLGSFVWHYKGVSRGIKPWNKAGAFRPAGKS